MHATRKKCNEYTILEGAGGSRQAMLGSSCSSSTVKCPDDTSDDDMSRIPTTSAFLRSVVLRSRFSTEGNYSPKNLSSSIWDLSRWAVPLTFGFVAIAFLVPDESPMSFSMRKARLAEQQQQQQQQQK